MRVQATFDRALVYETYEWSMKQVAIGALEHFPNADTASYWENARFQDPMSGREWIVYLPDHSWPGEVRVLVPAAAQ